MHPLSRADRSLIHGEAVSRPKVSVTTPCYLEPVQISDKARKASQIHNQTDRRLLQICYPAGLCFLVILPSTLAFSSLTMRDGSGSAFSAVDLRRRRPLRHESTCASAGHATFRPYAVRLSLERGEISARAEILTEFESECFWSYFAYQASNFSAPFSPCPTNALRSGIASHRLL